MDVLVKSAFWLAQEAEPYLEKTKYLTFPFFNFFCQILKQVLQKVTVNDFENFPVFCWSQFYI